jgi:hypothetical protein
MAYVIVAAVVVALIVAVPLVGRMWKGDRFVNSLLTGEFDQSQLGRQCAAWFNERSTRSEQRSMFVQLTSGIGCPSGLVADRLMACIMKVWGGNGALFGETLVQELDRLVVFDPTNATPVQLQQNASAKLEHYKARLRSLDSAQSIPTHEQQSDRDGRTAMFRSAEDNFQVMFQSQPDIREQGIVPALTSKTFGETTDLNYCQVSRTRVATYYGSPYDFLRTALDMLIRGVDNAVLTSANECYHSGLPAIAFYLEIGARAGRGVMVLEDKTIFNVMAVGIGSLSAVAERNQFVDSFGLLVRRAEVADDGARRAESNGLPEGWRTILETCDFKLAAQDVQRAFEMGIRDEVARHGPGTLYVEPRLRAVLDGFLDDPSIGSAIALLETLPTLWRIFELSFPGGPSESLDQFGR